MFDKKLTDVSNEISLINVEPTREHIRLLYEQLTERRHNISNTKKVKYEDHVILFTTTRIVFG